MDEMSERFTKAHVERDKRAHDYAYMSDDEFYNATKINISGDSAMKIGVKRALGLLPPSHLRRLQANGVSVKAVKEIPAMSPTHPYAPGMHPAGVFRPDTMTVEIADLVTLPDGTQRMLDQRQATLRHEVGHALDNITGLGDDPEIVAAENEGIDKMTDIERHAAGYWVGDTAHNDQDRIRTRKSEMFAELYAYAFADDADEYSSFGGLWSGRRFELFSKAKKLIREKLNASMGDRVTDWSWTRWAA
jgi:hypothetical protein